MKKLAFIMLLLVKNCYAQQNGNFVKLLADKNFAAFTAFIDTAKGNPNLSKEWVILNEIMPGYQQAVVKMTELVPYIMAEGGNVNNYTIRLLEHDGEIFYYDYCITKYKRGGDSTWHGYDDTIVFLKNKQAYADFKGAYFTTYHDTLIEKELFTQDVYGQVCGVGGMAPEGQVQLDSMLAISDIAAIRKWLISPIAERQLYAIEGYRALVGAGYTLTDEEERLLEIVKQKKATVETCAGCFFRAWPFLKMVKEIEETPARYLAAKVHRQERLFGRFPIKNRHKTMAVFIVPVIVIGIIVIVLRRRKQINV